MSIRSVFAFTALSAFVLPPPASAVGTNCTNSTTCASGQSRDFQIDCTLQQVTSAPCFASSPENRLLRVAVRCFDESEAQQARFADDHTYAGGALGFGSLVGSCASYIATAHWILDLPEPEADQVYQAQCSAGPAVPDCVSAVPEDQLDTSFLLYSLINPGGGVNACGPLELSLVELRSKAIARAYHGIVAGRYICSPDADLAEPTWNACQAELPPEGAPATGEGERIRGVNLAPASFDVFAVQPPPFNVCCDHELDTELDPGQTCAFGGHPTGRCSPLDVLCTSAVILGVCRDMASNCATPQGQFQYLDRPVWIGPRLDIGPGDGTLAPSAFPTACFKFSSSSLSANSLTENFTFGPALPAEPEEDGCGPPVSTRADVDFDETYDFCDPVIANFAPADGVQQITLRSKLRNEGPGPFDNNPSGGVDAVTFVEPISMQEVTATIVTVAFNDDFVHAVGDGVMCGANTRADSTARGDDIQVTPAGVTCLFSCPIAVAPGPDGVIDVMTGIGGDDMILDLPDEVRCGANKIAETSSVPQDLQVLGVGAQCGSSSDLVVAAGADCRLDTDPAAPPASLMVEVPPFGDFAPRDIRWESVAGPQVVALEPFVPKWFGYVLEGTADRLLGLDVTGTGEGVDDLNTSPTNSYVNLNCDTGDSLLSVDKSWDVTAGAVDSALTTGNSADRMVLVVSDVTLDSGPGWRMLPIDVTTHRPAQPGGVVLLGSGRAIHAARDSAGLVRAYIARKLGPDATTLAVVGVDPADPAGLWAMTDGTESPVTPDLHGLPLGIRARSFSNPDRTYAYVTTAECVKPMGDVPCPIGGCPDDRRKFWLSVVDVTDPENMSLTAEFNTHVAAVPNCGDSEAVVDSYGHMGLEFSPDGGMLLVTNPDRDRVDLLEVPAHVLNDVNRPGAPIPVGDRPVDVTVVHRQGNPMQPRAYVVNRTDRTITPIDLTTLTPSPDVIELGPGTNKYALDIEARTDGMRLYTANWVNQSVSVIDLALEAWTHDIITTFVTNQGMPTRLVLLRMPSGS